LHVTLCFLGSQPVGEIEAIAAACRRALAGRDAVDLQLGGPVWLPHRRPRVLAVALEDRSSLGELQAALAGELVRGGWYERDRRPFLPHVTVGRFGRAGGREVDLGAPASIAFAAVTVALLRSRLGPGGSRYESLASVGLESGG
jgi:2'-5' RNA ligase